MSRFHTLLTALVVAAAALLVPSSAHAQMPERNPHATWHKIHWHMNAYPDPDDGSPHAWRGCSGTWSDNHGSCWGTGETHHSLPYNGGKVRWEWHKQSTHCADFDGRDPQVWTHELYLHTTDVNPRQWVCGWVDKHWGTFRIVSGDFSWGVHRPVASTSAVVADREHTKGGPLFVFLGHRDGGYVLGMRGWIHY